MALELDITKEFFEMTNQMISILDVKKMTSENMNFWLVKVPLKESTVISSVDDFKKREAYKSGFGRVIAAPRLLDHETDAQAEVGDFVVYSHEAKYTVNQPVVNFLFDLKMDYEQGKEPIITIRDVDIIAVIPNETMLVRETANVSGSAN